MINPITYVKLLWKNKETALTTPVNANNLNRMENGIDAVTTQSNAIAEVVNALTTDVIAIKIVDSEDELPEIGAAKTIYYVKQEEEE